MAAGRGNACINTTILRGKLEGKREIAQKMLAKNLPEEVILEVSGFTKRDISKLKKELGQ